MPSQGFVALPAAVGMFVGSLIADLIFSNSDGRLAPGDSDGISRGRRPTLACSQPAGLKA